MKKKLNVVFYVFSFAAFLSVTFYFSTIRTDIKLIRQVNVFWLTSSVITQLLTYLFSALIYYRLLKIFQSSMQLTVWQLYQASIIALFANQVAPLAGISGNIFFYNYLKHKNIAVQNIFTVVIVELITFYVAIELIIVAVLAVYFFFIKTALLFPIILIAGFFAYLLFAYGIVLLGKKQTIIALSLKLAKIKWLGKYAEKLRTFVSENKNNLQNSMPFIRHHKRETANLTLLHIGTFLCDGYTIYSLFHGLGVSISFISVFIALILTKIISLLPVSPGALILYESSLTFFLTKLGAPFGTSVVVTLLFRLLSFWIPIPTGFLLTGELQLQRHTKKKIDDK
jgi:uncharacterized protein (TIRG00374 family)